MGALFILLSIVPAYFISYQLIETLVAGENLGVGGWGLFYPLIISTLLFTALITWTLIEITNRISGKSKSNFSLLALVVSYFIAIILVALFTKVSIH